jgi:dipeptidyl aminopeptidase/acylaminoacyl peptidase
VPVETPPPHVFRIVHYDSAVGKLPAYLSPDPQDGQKHPAIIWITGGDCNTIGDVWSEAPRDNDQTASAFRRAGIPMMFPSLRGGNDNPGTREGFFGEVDDVIAAADYLAGQPFVDPERIYLGGHSTGGTLVLLVAASSDRFRAVFSFGPVDDVSGYGLNSEYLPFNTWNRSEIQLRSPIRWLHSIQSPVFVFEGTGGNIDCLRAMKRRSKNPLLTCLAVKGADHFSILAPTNDLIAGRIASDTGPTTNLSFTEAELAALVGR